MTCRRAIALAIVIAAAFVGLAMTVPLPDRLDTAGSTVITTSDGTVAHVFLAPDDRWRIPVRMDQVDPAYVDALLAFEDERFWLHPGVDPLAVVRAAAQNLSQGRVVSGASTITMQLIRVLEPRPRTLRSKVIEAMRAVQLELRMSKAEILTAYLSFVPYGRNIEGIEAAAWTYFGHSAAALTPAEIATLLAVPQRPSERYPLPEHTSALRYARDTVAQRLANAGDLPTEGASVEAAIDRIRATPVPSGLRRIPRGVPHVAYWLRQSGRLSTVHPTPWMGQRYPTTLDSGVQALTERVVSRISPGMRNRGIHNIAVVVLEHNSGRVRALVGGFDFWADRDGAQIPAFDEPRSPGSTLKPFVYALGIDTGRILPERLVEDIPVRYGDYSPDNYDGGFDGLVTMEAALSRSLNVPFVNLLSRIGVERFLGSLRTMGARHLDPRPGHYGLSAAVGGIGLTPMEVAGMYATLARGGRTVPTTIEDTPADATGLEVWTDRASYLTRRALRLRDRPDFPRRSALAAMPPGIHWKTGTSFGHRDAWAVGSGRRYTVAVWLGNLNNRSSAHLVGGDTAGPVLFDILEGLGDGHNKPDDPPDGLRPMTLCALSGRRPSPRCAQTISALAPETLVPADRCNLHKGFEVDAETGQRVGPGCRAGRRTVRQTRTVWPDSVRRWMAARTGADAGLPELATDCRERATRAPRIKSPRSGHVALLIPGLDADAQEIPFEADGGGKLAWFADGAFLGHASAAELLWWTPVRGRHVVTAMDEVGRSDSVTIEVRDLL